MNKSPEKGPLVEEEVVNSVQESGDHDLLRSYVVVGMPCDRTEQDNMPVRNVPTLQPTSAPSGSGRDVLLIGHEHIESPASQDESSDGSESTPQPKHKSGCSKSSGGSTSTDTTSQCKQKSGETQSSDGTESTLRTVHPKLKPQGNISSDSGNLAVSHAHNQVISARYVLKRRQMLQMVRRGVALKLKSLKMTLRSKRNPTLHLWLEVQVSSPEIITLHAVIHVPQKYNHVLDTAKFEISITTTHHTCSSTPLPLQQPQPHTFTLIQENKHMYFQLFPHSYIRDSTNSLVDLVIEIEPVYDMYQDTYVPYYVEETPTDTFADIQRRRETNVVMEKIVSLTNEEQNIAWKEQQVTLHVPKDSLPEGCSKTTATMVVIYHSQASNGHSRHISYELKCIDGEQPIRWTFITNHRTPTVDTPQQSEH